MLFVSLLSSLLQSTSMSSNQQNWSWNRKLESCTTSTHVGDAVRSCKKINCAYALLNAQTKSVSLNADTHWGIGNRLFEWTYGILAFSLSLPCDIMISFLSISAYIHLQIRREVCSVFYTMVAFVLVPRLVGVLWHACAAHALFYTLVFSPSLPSLSHLATTSAIPISCVLCVRVCATNIHNTLAQCRNVWSRRLNLQWGFVFFFLLQFSRLSFSCLLIIGREGSLWWGFPSVKHSNEHLFLSFWASWTSQFTQHLKKECSIRCMKKHVHPLIDSFNSLTFKWCTRPVLMCVRVT